MARKINMQCMEMDKMDKAMDSLQKLMNKTAR